MAAAMDALVAAQTALDAAIAVARAAFATQDASPNDMNAASAAAARANAMAREQQRDIALQLVWEPFHAKSRALANSKLAEIAVFPAMSRQQTADNMHIVAKMAADAANAAYTAILAQEGVTLGVRVRARARAEDCNRAVESALAELTARNIDLEHAQQRASDLAKVAADATATADASPQPPRTARTGYLEMDDPSRDIPLKRGDQVYFIKASMWDSNGDFYTPEIARGTIGYISAFDFGTHDVLFRIGMSLHTFNIQRGCLLRITP